MSTDHSCERERRDEGIQRKAENKILMGVVGGMKVPRIKSNSDKRCVYLSCLGPVLLFTDDNKKPTKK